MSRYKRRNIAWTRSGTDEYADYRRGSTCSAGPWKPGHGNAGSDSGREFPLQHPTSDGRLRKRSGTRSGRTQSVSRPASRCWCCTAPPDRAQACSRRDSPASCSARAAARCEPLLHHHSGRRRHRQIDQAFGRPAREIPQVQLRRHGCRAVPPVTEGLGVRHLRMVIGNSMGGMQTWMWAAN